PFGTHPGARRGAHDQGHRPAARRQLLRPGASPAGPGGRGVPGRLGRRHRRDRRPHRGHRRRPAEGDPGLPRAGREHPRHLWRGPAGLRRRCRPGPGRLDHRPPVGGGVMAELNPMFDATFGSDPAPGNIDRPGFLALGFDPAPGSIERINTLADCLSDIARDLGEAYTDLKNLGKSEGIWTGTAAQAFANTVEELPEYLDKANSSFNDASSALSGWAQDLGEMQRKAASLEAEAAKAMANLIRAEANPDLGLVDQIFELGPELENAQRRLYAAQAELER